jgi:hypothetical protein
MLASWRLEKLMLSGEDRMVTKISVYTYELLAVAAVW